MTHAQDEMGSAAHKAALLASRLDLRLLGASSPEASREVRAANLRRALEQWPSLCRAMAELQEVAPTIASQAHSASEVLQDFRDALQTGEAA